MANPNTESLTPKQRLDQLDTVLNEYEARLGLAEFNEDHDGSEINTYLGMDRRQMEKLTVEDCAEIAMILDSFAFHLQRALNRETARVNWSKNVLREMISGRESQYNGSWDSQFVQAIKENSYAKGVFKIQNYAQQRADRITYLATSVRSRSNLFMNLQKAKAMR